MWPLLLLTPRRGRGDVPGPAVLRDRLLSVRAGARALARGLLFLGRVVDVFLLVARARARRGEAAGGLGVVDVAPSLAGRPTGPCR